MAIASTCECEFEYECLKERMNLIMGWGTNPDELIEVSCKIIACSENTFLSWLIKNNVLLFQKNDNNN